MFGKGSVADKRRRDDIFVPYTRLFRDADSPVIYPFDGLQRPDRFHRVDEFLESEIIRLMDWLARSSDVNNIEHV